MKFLFLMFVSLPVMAAECRLDTPIPLKGTNLNVHPHLSTGVVTLRNLKLNKTIETDIYTACGETNTSLPMLAEIYGVLVGTDEKTSFLGAGMRPAFESTAYESCGAGINVFFVTPYMVKGGVRSANGVQTNWVDAYQDQVTPPMTQGVLKMELVVEKDAITKLEWTWPVEKVIRQGNYVYREYQGRNENVCVQSAELFVDGKKVE